jgi:amidohydrolase
MLKERIQELAKLYSEEFINVRHHIHANPELSYKEFETSKFVQQKLQGWNIPFEVKATTGVVGLIKGKNPGKKIIALRADMDALPITEANDVPYRSLHEGVMHACGHDVHTTCLLGAAKILSELKEEWEGTVKLIFQPGEEKNPGGASLMIKDGVLEDPKPEKIFALHVHPGMEVGQLSFRGGMIMASADELYITIKAKGGHAAAPHLTPDTILIASHLIISLQQIVSRNNDPFNPSVLSITAFNGGNTTNVIPSKAHELIKKQTHQLVEAMGAEADILVDVGYPFVLNDEVLNTASRKKAEDYMGAANVSETELRMGAEDFAYYSQKMPACFFRLGAGNKEKGITSGVHTPTFNIDERAIEVGMGMMAWLGADQ